MVIRYLKKILFVLFIIFVGIQFMIPVRNENGQVLSTDIIKTFHVPDSVLSILKMACYDCHSNNTNYPWYTYIQPIGWILNHHIQKGKAVLNFSEFGSYTYRRQKSKIRSIASQIKENKMPLYSYTLMHKNAILSNKNKAIITDWLQKTLDSLSLNLKQ